MWTKPDDIFCPNILPLPFLGLERRFGLVGLAEAMAFPAPALFPPASTVPGAAGAGLPAMNPALIQQQQQQQYLQYMMMVQAQQSAAAAANAAAPAATANGAMDQQLLQQQLLQSLSTANNEKPKAALVDLENEPVKVNGVNGTSKAPKKKKKSSSSGFLVCKRSHEMIVNYGIHPYL
eukprot:s4209_g9.t1